MHDRTFHRLFRRRCGFMLIELVIVLAIVGIIAAVILGAAGGFGTPDPRAAIRAAETHGFSQVRVLDTHRWAARYGCGEDDGVAFDVAAVNRADREVRMTVCCGTGFSAKGCTIRTH